MDQIFNELSVSGCYKDKYAARCGMDTIVDVSKAIAGLGMSKMIRTTRDFAQRWLAPDYSIEVWKRDRDIDRDRLRYFLQCAGKSPYIENFLNDHEDGGDLVEFRFSGEPAWGLGLSCLWKIPSISLTGDSRFTQENIEISELRVTPHGEINKAAVVSTFSCVDQVTARKAVILERLQTSIKNGKHLLEQAQAMLPHLAFGHKASADLGGLHGNEQFFPEVVCHFFELNRAMVEWFGGPFEPALDFTGESPSTKQNKGYSQKRSFVCADGIERKFVLHSKIKSANKRIYFFPILGKKIVHIGYVGDHLPSTKHPT